MDQTVQAQTPQPVVQTPPPQPPTMPVTPSAPESQPKPSRKAPVVLIILLILLAVAGTGSYFLLRQQEEAEPAAPLVHRPTLPSPTPQPKVDHYIGSQTITLLDVSGGTASGSATRNITAGNTAHTIQVSLPDPLEGSLYQVWIVRSGNFIPIGKLIADVSGSYTLSTNFTFDPKSPPFKTFEELHNTIAVTLETTDDEVMETRILEGTFTQ